jgi:FkbM family methyltransferase
MAQLRANSADVQHAYRLLLGRDPDSAGLAHFEKFVAENNVFPRDLAALFLNSEEFRDQNAAFPTLEEVSFHGIKLFPWKGDALIGEQIKISGEYEPHMLPLFVDRVPVDGVVLDIGANIGTYALSAARKVGPGGHVFAIEPVSRNVQSLCAGIVANGLTNVSVLPIAASARAGVVPILRNTNSSNGIVDTHSKPTTADGYVPAQRLDFLLADLKRLDVVKIDIEGHEPIVWPSLEVLLRRHRPVVFAEFNPAAIRNHSRVDAKNFLNELFAIAPSIDVLRLDKRRVSCVSPDQIMEEWRDVNRRMGSVEGYCVDLMFETSAQS